MLNYEESATCPPEVGDICITMFQGQYVPMILSAVHRAGHGFDWLVTGDMFIPMTTPQHASGVMWKPAQHLCDNVAGGLSCWPKLLRGHEQRIKDAEAIIEAHRKAVPPGYVKAQPEHPYVDHYNHVEP